MPVRGILRTAPVAMPSKFPCETTIVGKLPAIKITVFNALQAVKTDELAAVPIALTLPIKVTFVNQGEPLNA